MKRICTRGLLFILIILLFSAIAEAKTFSYFEVEVLRDPLNTPLTGYTEYLAMHPLLPFDFRIIGRYYGATDEPLPFVIVVQDNLYTQIQSSIDTYISDLVAEDYEPVVYTITGGTPEELKDEILIPEWESGAVGATLIGDLPIPWFELYEDFDNDGLPDNPWRVSFPCDLFYMDLNGVWVDTAGTVGIYDGHEGDWEPDFWIGRIYAGTMLAGEVQLAQNYFDKLHLYRQGDLNLPDMGLAYIDDDWAGGAGFWAQALETSYANTVLVSEINETTADDYQARWDDQYQYVLLAAHSGPTSHSLKQNNGLSWSSVFNWEIIEDDPNFFFYNLFCCSNCRFTETDYCGGAYLFNDTYGLNVIGSTKTGAMLFFEDYYPHLGTGETFGEAFNQWFALHGNEPGAQTWARSWFYGMTGLGDPALSIIQGMTASDFTFIDDGSGSTSGDGDGIPDAGETVELEIWFVNRGIDTYSNLTVEATSSDTLIDIVNNSANIPPLAPGDSALVGGILFTIDEWTPDLHPVEIDFEITNEPNNIWYEEITFEIRAPLLELVSYRWREIEGNMNGFLDEGETIGMIFTVNNYGGQEATKDAINIGSYSENFPLVILPGEYYFPVNEPVELDEAEIEFGEFPHGYADYGYLHYNDPEPNTDIELFYLPGGQTVNIYDPCGEEENRYFYPVSEGYASDWNFEPYVYHNDPPCVRFGTDDNYPPYADGAMELPLIKLGDNTTLSFYHRYGIEPGYDGGILEIFYDDEWQLLTPAGGYPGTSVSNGSYPGGPCYNGEVDIWTEAIFNLSDYEGCVKIRFRFGSDGGTEDEGWYIDDITVDSEVTGVEPGITGATPYKFEIVGNYPNPFNASTNISFTLPSDGCTRITMVNSLGQEVSVLAEGILPGGLHNYAWNAGNNASGLYFYRIEYEGQRLIGKCLLVK